jgi:hypothetical protein
MVSLTHKPAWRTVILEEPRLQLALISRYTRIMARDQIAGISGLAEGCNEVVDCDWNIISGTAQDAWNLELEGPGWVDPPYAILWLVQLELYLEVATVENVEQLLSSGQILA